MMPARLISALRSSVLYSAVLGLLNFGTQVLFARRLGLDVVSVYALILIAAQVANLALSTGVNHAVIALGASRAYLRAGWVLQLSVILAGSFLLGCCTLVAALAFRDSFVAHNLNLFWLVFAGNMAFLAAHVVNVDLESALEYGTLYRIRFLSSMIANLCGAAMTFVEFSAFPIVLRDFLLGTVYLGISLAFASRNTRTQLRLSPHRADVALVARVARGNWGINLVSATVTRLDYWLVAAVLGQPSIGLYYQIRALVDGVLTTALTLIQSVLFSYFSSQPDKPSSDFLKPKPLVAAYLVAFFAMLLAAVLGRFVVHLVLGPQWAAGAPALVGLAGYVVLRLCYEVLISFAKSKHLQRRVLESQVIGIVVQLVTIPIFIWCCSLLGAGIASAFAAAAILLGLYRRLARSGPSTPAAV
jgi:O-antigen/teichoic acid export membrane protein